jgi:hypothetical protein
VGFDVVDVTGWVVVSQEPEGADPKEWLARPGNLDDLWLYKRPKVGRDTGYRRYDDVAERLASALAEDIGLPAAQVEFARRGADDGVISRNIRPEGWELHSGDVRLSECPGYETCSGDARPKDRVGHNLANIRSILAGCGAPPGLTGDHSAFSVFAGYLVFDAWIANTDRHAINWAVLEQDGEQRLAPSFDHGSAMASGIGDAHLSGRNPVKFACGAKATRFEDGRAKSLVGLALEAVELAGAPARTWVERVARYDFARLDDLLSAAGNTMRLSEGRSTFIRGILQENQRRLRG